jgi:hypothetical protein
MRLLTLALLTALLLTLGCARPEPVATPPQAASPPSGAWYSPRNWFRRFDSGGIARKPADDERQNDGSAAMRVK